MERLQRDEKMSRTIVLSENGRSALSEFFQTHTKRDTPKINGSFGGFIALVVCLVLIIIVACTAIFLLLRDQKTFDEEQARRRQNNQYLRSPTTHMPSYIYKDSSAPRSWRTRIATIFTIGGARNHTHSQPDTNRVRMKRGIEHGWIQAGSRDDWDSDFSDERRQAVGQLGTREVTSPPPMTKQPTPVSRSTSDSASSVRFDLHTVRGMGHPDGHLPPHATLPNIHSHLSSPSSSPALSPSPVRTMSPELIHGAMVLDTDVRPYVKHTTPSIRTFAGGTKFIEDL